MRGIAESIIVAVVNYHFRCKEVSHGNLSESKSCGFWKSVRSKIYVDQTKMMRL